MLLFATIGRLNVKGFPKCQGILTWIQQILHLDFRKQHKKVESSRVIEQNVVMYKNVYMIFL